MSKHFSGKDRYIRWRNGEFLKSNKTSKEGPNRNGNKNKNKQMGPNET